MLFLSPLSAQTNALRVIEEEAIPFTGFLSKADFDQRYPGKIVTTNAQLTVGWYVIYEHEALNYYFGPILLQSTGEDYLEQLKGIVGEAVVQRPDLQNYRLELSYEPSTPSTSGSGGTSGSQSGSPATPSTPAPQPTQSWGIFDFFRRLFGM